MNTRHLVDPELLARLDAPPMELRHDNLDVYRRVMSEMTRGDLPPDVSMSRAMAPGSRGADVPVFIYAPAEPELLRPAVLYVHGGGFVLGAAADWGPACAKLALEQGCVVASVDYRLAPETPFPGPLEDCYAALCWLYGAAESLAVDPRRIVICGPSAGGGLAAALALAARDRGGPPVCAQFLTYPMLDHRTGTVASPHDNPTAGEFGWTAALNQFGWRAMMGGRDDPSPSHLCSPSRAESLAGLPPTFIAVGALDLFVDENMEYARRLIQAGVPVELHVYPGAFHGFDFTPEAAVSKQFERDHREALARALTRRI